MTILGFLDELLEKIYDIYVIGNVIRKFNSSKGEISIFIVLGLILIGGMAMVGGLLPGEKEPKPEIRESDKATVQESAPEAKEAGIQLKTLTYTTTAPPPPDSPGSYARCPVDNGIPGDETCICNKPGEMKIECRNRQCVRVISPKIWNCENQKALTTEYCQSKVFTPVDGIFCLAKPVIYLYPTKKIVVDVSVKTEGKVVVSDPLYPAGGWKNVTAFPSGKLIYQGKEYRELFYESETEELNSPKEGLIVHKENINDTLKDLNKKLGLSDWESTELRDFWVPRLKKVSMPYLFVTLIQGKEKDRIDEINITPKPDTMIEVLYYFKPVEKPYETPTLILPPTPKRVGFTAVEWGGTLDK